MFGNSLVNFQPQSIPNNNQNTNLVPNLIQNKPGPNEQNEQHETEKQGSWWLGPTATRGFLSMMIKPTQNIP